MKQENYIRILQEMSSWRIVDGFKPGREVLLKLSALLDGVPCFLSPGGDLFIGASAPDKIPGRGVCVRAPLCGGGGALRLSSDGKFLFSEISGLSGEDGLLGAKFGAFAARGGAKLFELEAEIINKSQGRAAVYFLPEKAALESFRAAGPAVATHPSSFEFSDGRIKCWNLSALANAALLVYLLKENAGRPGLVGVLEYAAPGGPAGLLHLDLWPMRPARGGQEFGFEFRGLGTAAAGELLQAVPPGGMPAGAAGAIARVQVDNDGNRAENTAFAPEELSAERFWRYAALAGALLDAMCGAKPPVAPAGTDGQIEVCGEAAALSALAAKTSDFADFLSSAAPALAEAQGRHGLSSSAVTSSAYETLAAGLKAEAFELGVSDEELREWAAGCRGAVSRLLPATLGRKIKIVTLLMLPVPSASSDSGETLRVFLSLDRIGRGKLKEALYSELSFRLAKASLEKLGVPGRLVRFYAEGVRCALPAAALGGSLAEKLGLGADKFAELSAGLPGLKEKMGRYLSGETLGLHEGRYHRFFRDSGLGDPYVPGAEAGYGTFLAALEVSELISSGKLNEKILSL